jgi:hypothetical protein
MLGFGTGVSWGGQQVYVSAVRLAPKPRPSGKLPGLASCAVQVVRNNPDECGRLARALRA